MENKIRSGQSTVEISNNICKKYYDNIVDFTQEKYFTKKIMKVNPSLVPTNIHFDKTTVTMTSDFAGIKLEEAYKDEIPLEVFYLIISKMETIWNSTENVKNSYNYKESEFIKYMGDFLLNGYRRVLRSKDIQESYIDKAIIYLYKSLTDIVATKPKKSLIHLDLSPRNILIDKNDVKVIDWSRAIHGYRVFDIGIMFSKCRFHEHSEKEKIKQRLEELGENYDHIVCISNIFDIFRHSKRIDSYKKKENIEKLIENLYETI